MTSTLGGGLAPRAWLGHASAAPGEEPVMPFLVLDNMRKDLYERLRRQAQARRRPLVEEALFLWDQALPAQAPAPPLPEYVPSEETSAPFDLPLPEGAVRSKGRWGEPPLPDPLDEERD